VVWWRRYGRESGGKPPHSTLTAGDGNEMALRTNGAGGGSELLIAGLNRFREGEQRGGIDGGDGTTTGESNGNLRRSDVLREFGDGQEIEAAGGEKRGVDGAAEPLDGSANHGGTILGSVGQVAPSLIGETNLEAIVGHGGLVLEEG